MSALAARLRGLSRAHKPPPRVAVRAFHSPFVVLNASNPLTAPSASTAAPVYEKQDDTSSEPHLTSSGTRTYVVSEPDPSNTPYQVPSGAYPASASYLSHHSAATHAKSLYTHSRPAFQHDSDTGGSAAGRSAGVPGARSSQKENNPATRSKSGEV